MSGLITGYDPKTQNFIDTDLFDVSKHVTQTSGVLEVGVSYTILDFQTGDNFTNVGGTNVTGNVFVATGTTPTAYTYGSTLAKYVTQSYTYAELKSGLGLGSKVYKALLTQKSTSAPVATVLVNTLGITTTWVYDNIGEYSVNVDSGIIDNAKVFIDKELKIISPSYIDDQAAQIGVFDGAVTRVSLKSTVFTTGVAANDIINSFTLTIEVFP